MVCYPFHMKFHSTRLRTLTHRVLCLSGTAAVLVTFNYVVFVFADPNMFDEFRESYLQDDTTSIFMQPYSKYLVGVNALILALIVPGVPCFGFFGAKRNNRPCLGCFVCCSCCGGCLHVLHAILMILLLIGLSSVETVCRRNGSCVGIMEACKYRKSDDYALDTYEGCLDYLVSKFPLAYAGLGLVLGLNSVVICFQCFSARWGYELHDALSHGDLCEDSDSDGM